MESSESKPLRRLVFDARPFILLFTDEKGSDIARKAILPHERGDVEIFMYLNNLVEAFLVISRVIREKPELPVRRVG